MKCLHCGNDGFCTKYSNDAVVWKCEKKSNCKGLAAEKIESPCKTCTMVKYPESCDNKSCWGWKQWFIDRWEEMRRYYHELQR